MSCWSLRLPAPKKAWKTFTSKLLKNLRKPKPMKKQKIHGIYFLEQRRRHHLLSLQTRKPNHTLRFRNHGRYVFKKKAELAPAPVYIDRLFKDPIAAAEVVIKYPHIAKDEEAGGTSNNDEKVKERACASAADDMWESLALTSSQMNGIDQRAEKFIQTFRKEMQLEELMARRS